MAEKTKENLILITSV